MIILEIITIKDNKYPEQLRKIPNPPKQLYCEGNVELLKNNIISIIGSRTCTQNGIELTQKFTKELVYQQITIASGMALGIDSVAHKTTLQEKGKIIENQGLIITEYMPYEVAESKKFLERNRIVSGLALRSFSNRGSS